MGAGSQSRFNRLLPDLGFRNRSRHKGVHCVRTGMKSVMPAPFRPARAMRQRSSCLQERSVLLRHLHH